ncbi:hypothetical protein E4U35_006714 [Claviceps purpurea]|nr:hypothetical protein E4U12_005667 [Claviceps purpurea]KAG6163136.1 hypothetical protein E4U51_005912 [Claviceps purpurea]KAG6199338.1 hypothetical protein E4U35_006714 [Claviceps purpurea]
MATPRKPGTPTTYARHSPDRPCRPDAPVWKHAARKPLLPVLWKHAGHRQPRRRLGSSAKPIAIASLRYNRSAPCARLLTTGPGYILAQDFKRHYKGYWAAALNGESPACPTEEEHVRLCRLPDHYVLKTQKTQTQRQTSCATQRAVASWYDSTGTPQQKTKDKTMDNKGEDLDYEMTNEERPGGWRSIIGASKVDRHKVWHTYVVKNCPRRFFSLTGEPINALEAAKEEVLPQTTQQPFVASTFVRLVVETTRPG